MADSTTWTRWYRTGTVSLTKDSKTVNGTGTYWLSASIHAGDIFSIDSVTDYEIDEVVSDTQLTLMTAYQGKTASGKEYAVIRSFSSTTGSEVAAQTADLVSKMAVYVDTDMQKVQGASAYQIAKTHGYVGTESAWVDSLKGLSAYEVAKAGGYTGTQAEWLESLKAAGEWSKLDKRTECLTNPNAYTRNYLYRGKSLGTEITDEQWAAIANGTYTDMYIGDYWTIPTDYTEITKDGMLEDRVGVRLKWQIIAFDYFPWHLYNGAWPHQLMLDCITSGAFQTKDHEGGQQNASGGFAGTEVYTVKLRSLHDYYTELWGSSHLKGFLNDKITCDAAGNYVKNELAVTVAPLKFFIPEVYPADGGHYECGGFYWRFPTAGQSSVIDYINGSLSRNLQGNEILTYNCFSHYVFKTPMRGNSTPYHLHMIIN